MSSNFSYSTTVWQQVDFGREFCRRVNRFVILANSNNSFSNPEIPTYSRFPTIACARDYTAWVTFALRETAPRQCCSTDKKLMRQAANDKFVRHKDAQS